jgi:hypothetical protein
MRLRPDRSREAERMSDSATAATKIAIETPEPASRSECCTDPATAKDVINRLPDEKPKPSESTLVVDNNKHK